MKIIMLFICLVIFAECKSPRDYDSVNKGRPLPVFKIHLVDSTFVTDINALSRKKPIILFIFDPECSHCRDELKGIIHNIKDFSNCDIIMVTFTSFSTMRNFSSEFGLNKYANVIVGKDTAHFLINHFQLTAVPFTAVYDSSHLLLKTYSTKVDANSLLKNLPKSTI